MQVTWLLPKSLFHLHDVTIVIVILQGVCFPKGLRQSPPGVQLIIDDWKPFVTVVLLMTNWPTTKPVSYFRIWSLSLLKFMLLRLDDDFYVFGRIIWNLGDVHVSNLPILFFLMTLWNIKEHVTQNWDIDFELSFSSIKNLKNCPSQLEAHLTPGMRVLLSMDPLTGVTLFLVFSSMVLEYSPSGYVAGRVLRTEICLTQNNVIICGNFCRKRYWRVKMIGLVLYIAKL